MAFDELLQQTAMQAISMQSRLVYRCLFINVYRALEYIDRTNKDEGFALDASQMCNQAIYFLPICLRLLVGDPLLSGSTSTDNGIERLAVNTIDSG
ncbi:hypothetical protein ACG10_06625 [Azotobacter chroococcum]|nr:hypothetical protein ACG10_06625 [Azotobacter chroococcum]